MQNASHTIREELFYILLFLGAIWAVFGLSCVFRVLERLTASLPERLRV